MFKEVKLPSGAVLKLASAPFATSKALYQALLKEMKAVNIGSKGELGDTMKNIMCAGFSSPEVERCLEACMGHCLYDDGKGRCAKIDKDTFEPLAAREDYTSVCIEVAQENVSPFGKSLFALYCQMLASAESTPALRPQTTPSLPTSN